MLQIVFLSQDRFSGNRCRYPIHRLAKQVYSEFCRRAPLTRHFDWEHARKQMAKIHAPHLRGGYVAEVAFEATTDRESRPDWTLVYTPGPKAKAEHQAFTRRCGMALLALEPPPAEAKAPEVEPEPTGLERELVERGVTGSVAADLVRDFPEDRIKAQIEQVDWLRETKPKRIADVGAYLAKAVRQDFAAPAGFTSKAERAARETAQPASGARAGGRGPAGEGPGAGGRGPDQGVPGDAEASRTGAAGHRGPGRGRPGDPRRTRQHRRRRVSGSS